MIGAVDILSILVGLLAVAVCTARMGGSTARDTSHEAPVITTVRGVGYRLEP